MRNLGLIGGMAMVAIFTGCEQKAQLPTTPPLAAAEPGALLDHLKYLAGSQDVKHLVVITPVSDDVVYPSSWWFHTQCKNLGINLTAEEITKLGIDKIKDRLDNLPRAPEPGYGNDEARAAFNSGLFRLIKGFPKEAWAAMVVSEVKPNSVNARVTDVTIAFKGTKVLAISCIKKSETAWGIANLQYLVRPEAMLKSKK